MVDTYATTVRKQGAGPPDGVSQTTEDFARFDAQISALLPSSRIVRDTLRRVALGMDASFYRLIPRLIILVEDEAEILQVIKIAHQTGIPITFRAAGTSLSGQAVTDSVLVKLGHDGWQQCSISPDGNKVTAGPALTGAQVNSRLAPFSRKIGPDPASINSAMIGGIAANNASGMCCGIAQNSYQTLSSMRIVLADGTLVDTGDEDSRSAFRQSHSAQLSALEKLADKTRANPTLSERIRKKYAIKNTMGYSLNALLDFQDPINILQHLMIGSEGTLGFISQITYRTVAVPRHKASALVFFLDIRSACKAAARLKISPVAAVELMDDRSLNSVSGKPGMPEFLEHLPKGTAALLIEVHGDSPEDIKAKGHLARQTIADIPKLEPVSFTADPSRCAQYWNIRKGLFPAVGAVRETGTTVIIEDVAVSVDQLADAVIDLQTLFAKHNYDEAIIFGHALEGNVHFVFTQSFANGDEVARYGAFMNDLSSLIVSKYDGSLKAEHSTGRNMAPFVEMEWGAQAYELMCQIKEILDTRSILNPGVIINDDPHVHLANLKPIPGADAIIDKCIECGFCEATCPSRAFTLSPRQRIIALREIARLKADGHALKHPLEEITQAFEHQGINTCAGDGLCALACPVGIDTGQAMRAARAAKHGAVAHFTADLIANNFGFAVAMVRIGLLATDILRTVLGTKKMKQLFSVLNWATRGTVPRWTEAMPTPAPPPTQYRTGTRPRLVYFPSCAARVFGPASGAPNKDPLPTVVIRILQNAGYDVVLPEHLERLCCGMPFHSKGFVQTATRKTEQLIDALKSASRNGKDTIIFDTSPCALQALEKARKAGLKTADIIDALNEFILGKTTLTRSQDTIAIHTVCSAQRMGQGTKLRAIADKLAHKVIVPPDIQCCGFAGDKGFTVPELNASALRHLKSALPDTCTHGYSTSRTCEIGLTTHSGRHYQSIAYLVDRCTVPYHSSADTTKNAPCSDQD